MKSPKFSIDINEAPPGATAVAATQASFKTLSLSASGLCTSLLGLAAVAFFALQFNLTESIVPKVAFAVGLIGFIVARQCERHAARQLAQFSPVPDEFLAEAALLCAATPAARKYRDALRVQKREMILAEFEALKKLVGSAPVSASREALYGCA